MGETGGFDEGGNFAGFLCQGEQQVLHAEVFVLERFLLVLSFGEENAEVVRHSKTAGPCNAGLTAEVFGDL